MDEFANQLRLLFGKKARNIDSRWRACLNKSYAIWNRKTQGVISNVPSLLKYLVDMFTDNREVGVFCFGDTIQNEDEKIHIISDAVDEVSPIMQSYPFFVECDDATAWVYSFVEVSYLVWDCTRFKRTKYIYKREGSKARIYKSKEDSSYWYLDFFHKNNRFHYEVFSEAGDHLGEADKDGKIDVSKADKKKNRFMKRILSQ